MSWSKIALSQLLILASIATYTHAAPSCNPGWDTLGVTNKSVCQIAENLLAKHCPGSGNFSSLQPVSTWYNVSSFSSVENCACTTIVWNLLTACAGCQMSSLEDAKGTKDWPNVKQYQDNNCWRYHEAQGGPELQTEPNGSASDAAWRNVPPWTRRGGPNFNLQAILNLTNQSSAPSAGEPPSTSTTTDLVPTTTEVSATPIANVTSGGSGSNIGAIVGGVVGAVALLSAILALLFFLRYRKRRARDVAPSSEFLKPEYYASPPLLAPQNHRDSEYQEDIEEEEATTEIAPRRLSWMSGIVTTRRHEGDGDEMLPPFTQGTYIGPSPHEKGLPERRRTDESDATVTSSTHLLSSSSCPGISE